MLPNEGLVTRALLVMAALALTAPATVATADDGVIIDVSGAKRGRYPIAVPVAVDSDGAVAAEVASVASFDLGVAGYFKVLDPASFLADLGALFLDDLRVDQFVDPHRVLRVIFIVRVLDHGDALP